jgi:hypothetical protein
MTDCLKRQQRTERVKKPGTSAEKMGWLLQPEQALVTIPWSEDDDCDVR